MKIYLSILLSLLVLPATAIEELKYTVLEKNDKMEIRKYESYIKASVSYTDKDEFEQNAFRDLADFIFGNNIKNQEIAMTAPVITSEKIAMTAPVLSNEDAGSWTMSFSMPSKYTMETLPKPVNKNVEVSYVPERIFAAIRYSGFDNDKKRKKHHAKLSSWLSNITDYSIDGPTMYAGYNPPWSLPFLRRNEVLIPLR